MEDSWNILDRAPPKCPNCGSMGLSNEGRLDEDCSALYTCTECCALLKEDYKTKVLTVKRLWKRDEATSSEETAPSPTSSKTK